MKSSLRFSHGFTLVELAIVMTIIGLLIAGVLKGQEMITNSRVINTVAQVNAYRAAAISFRDQYSYYPGDIPRASDFLPDCPEATCNPASTLDRQITEDGRGNGIVGRIGWAWSTAARPFIDSMAGDPDVGRETLLFWAHLSKAGYITDVSADSAYDDSLGVEKGRTTPKSAFGGGIGVAHALPPQPDTITGQPARVGIYNGGFEGAASPVGLSFVLSAPGDGCVYNRNADNGDALLSPHVARMIDLKMDDGNPRAGIVVAANCGTDYQTGGSNKCSLVFAEGSLFYENITSDAHRCRVVM